MLKCDLYNLHQDQIFWMYHIPINSVENDAFIIGLDNMYMAMMFPIIPKAETIVNNTPSMINRNIITNFFWQQNDFKSLEFILCKENHETLSFVNYHLLKSTFLKTIYKGMW